MRNTSTLCVNENLLEMALDASEDLICKIRTLSEMTTKSEGVAVMYMVEDFVTVFESKMDEIREKAYEPMEDVEA